MRLKKTRNISFIISLFILIAFMAGDAFCMRDKEEEEGLVAVEGGNMSMGVALGGAGTKTGYDLCPEGVMAIRIFMSAWQRNDYETMYALLDEESRKDYPFKRARFDFQFLEFKPYEISLVRKDGENFEFLLSYGDWKDGDKVVEKMIVSGKSFKIIMPTKNSPFKKSAASYF